MSPEMPSLNSRNWRTVGEIQDGDYCPNCAYECVHFAGDADCCICDTFIGRLYSQVNPDDLERRMEFKPVEGKFPEVFVCVVGGKE